MNPNMTSKQHITLNMSLLPLAIILILILGVGYLLLKGEIKLPKFNQGPQIRRLTGFPMVVNTDKDLEKQRLVLKSEQELDQFLNFIDSSGNLVLKDKIDFSKEFVLAVTTPTNLESGRSIKIKKVYEDKKNNRLTVSIEDKVLGQNCEVNNQKNVAVDLAVISKTDAHISFERIRKVQECNIQKTQNETSSSANP